MKCLFQVKEPKDWMQSYHLDIEKVSILKFLYSLNLNHSPKKLKKTFDILQKNTLGNLVNWRKNDISIFRLCHILSNFASDPPQTHTNHKQHKHVWVIFSCAKCEFGESSWLCADNDNLHFYLCDANPLHRWS